MSFYTYIYSFKFVEISVADSNYIVPIGINQFIKQVINAISRVIYCLISYILNTPYNFQKALKAIKRQIKNSSKSEIIYKFHFELRTHNLVLTVHML